MTTLELHWSIIYDSPRQDTRLCNTSQVSCPEDYDVYYIRIRRCVGCMRLYPHPHHHSHHHPVISTALFIVCTGIITSPVQRFLFRISLQFAYTVTNLCTCMLVCVCLHVCVCVAGYACVCVGGTEVVENLDLVWISAPFWLDDICFRLIFIFGLSHQV